MPCISAVLPGLCPLHAWTATTAWHNMPAYGVKLAELSDVQGIAELRATTFLSSQRFLDVIWPRGGAERESLTLWFHDSIGSDIKSETNIVVKAVVGDRVVGVGVGTVMDPAINGHASGPSGPPGCDQEQWTYLGEVATAHKKKLANGRVYMNIGCITTAADHQRQGIATAVTRILLNEAARRGLPCILMSSEQGWPVYKRLGFIQRDLFVWQKADGTLLDMPSEPVAILEPPSSSEKAPLRDLLLSGDEATTARGDRSRKPRRIME